MNESEKGAIGGSVITCVVEDKALENFVHIMRQPPLFSIILQYLTFEEINKLREAVKYCRATASLHDVILYKGLLKLIPYDTSLINSLTPIFKLVRQWHSIDYPGAEDTAVSAQEMFSNFKVLRIVSLKHDSTCTTDGISPSVSLSTSKNAISMAGEVDKQTVFYLGFEHTRSTKRSTHYMDGKSSTTGCKCLSDYGRAFIIYAPTYAGLIQYLRENGMMDRFVNNLNTSCQLSNALKNLSPGEAGDILVNHALTPFGY